MKNAPYSPSNEDGAADRRGYVVQTVSAALLLLATSAHWHIVTHPSLPDAADEPIYFTGEEILFVVLQVIFLCGVLLPWVDRLKARVAARDAGVRDNE